MLREVFDTVLARLLVECRRHYGDRLVSLVVFGSVGRGTPRPDSDIDFLVVARDLPDGRMPRVDDYLAVERALKPVLDQARAGGACVELSPVFKTPEEARQGSLLFLDMIDDARFLQDSEDFFRDALAGFKARLDRLGARRIWMGNAWVWDLKPDYKPGDVFEI
jgi:uncharacterized protein